MANMFAKAKETKKTPAKKAGKSKPQINVENLNTYAALVAAGKTIETMITTLKGEVNDEALDAFVRRQNKETLEGIDGDTTASLQLKKRTSRSTLSEQELSVLKDAEIDTEQSADSKFFINSEHAENEALMEKVSDALDGIVPDDFFGHTGEKFIVGDNAVGQALKISDEDDRRSVLKIVATQAARPKFGGTHEAMLEILDEVLKG